MLIRSRLTTVDSSAFRINNQPYAYSVDGIRNGFRSDLEAELPPCAGASILMHLYYNLFNISIVKSIYPRCFRCRKTPHSRHLDYLAFRHRHSESSTAGRDGEAAPTTLLYSTLLYLLCYAAA